MRVRGANIDYWVSQQVEDRVRRLDELAAQQHLLRRIESPPIRPIFAVVRRFLVLAGTFMRRTRILDLPQPSAPGAKPHSKEALG